MVKTHVADHVNTRPGIYSPFAETGFRPEALRAPRQPVRRRRSYAATTARWLPRIAALGVVLEAILHRFGIHTPIGGGL